MSLPPLATTDDLATWLRRGAFSTTDEEAAELVLKHVSSLIRAESGATYVTDDGDLDDLPEGVEGLALAVAAQVWDNPTFQAQRTTGPFSISFGPNVGLFLTDEQRLTLSGAGQKAFTIVTTPQATLDDPLRGAQVNGPAGWAPGEFQW